MGFEKWCSEKLDRDVSFTNIEKLFGVLQEEPLLSHALVLVKNIFIFVDLMKKLPDGGFACIHRIGEIYRKT